MEKHIKGIIFDLDGTLIDSMGMWRGLDKHFILSQGVEYDPKISREIVGMTLEQAAAHFCKVLSLPKTASQVVDEWRAYLFNQYKHNILLKSGAKEFVEKCYKEGIKMCIATLTEKQMATMVLKKYELLDKMEFVLTVYEVGKSKLNPDIYLECSKKMGISARECLVVEDTCHAIKTAKKAGYTVYAIHEETSTKVDEIKEICDRYIMDFTELL